MERPLIIMRFFTLFLLFTATAFAGVLFENKTFQVHFHEAGDIVFPGEWKIYPIFLNRDKEAIYLQEIFKYLMFIEKCKNKKYSKRLTLISFESVAGKKLKKNGSFLCKKGRL